MTVAAPSSTVGDLAATWHRLCTEAGIAGAEYTLHALAICSVLWTPPAERTTPTGFPRFGDASPSNSARGQGWSTCEYLAWPSPRNCRGYRLDCRGHAITLLDREQ